MTFTQFAQQQLESRADKKLDLADATRILQDDIDRQAISEDGFLRENYDFFKSLNEDRDAYLQQYVGSDKATQQNELKEKINQFFEDEPALINFSKTRRAELERILQSDSRS